MENKTEEKKHVNPFLVRKNSEKPEVKKMVEELEDLNWQVQLASWNLDLLGAKYNLKKLKYLKAIGYDITDEEIKAAEDLAADLGKEQEDGCTICK